MDKRGPDALIEHAQPVAEPTDFPCLTDVVEPAPARPGSIKSAPIKSVSTQPSSAQAVVDVAGIEPSPELLATIESRLAGLMARHRQEVDEAVRRIVQEELARRGK